MTQEPSTHDGPLSETVRMEIPAQLRFVSLVRVASASLAADLDPIIDDVEDLRVAVNELAGLLVEASDGATIAVQMWTDERTVHVSGRCNGPSSPVAPDQLTERILAATVDSYLISDGSFRVHKRLGAD